MKSYLVMTLYITHLEENASGKILSVFGVLNRNI